MKKRQPSKAIRLDDEQIEVIHDRLKKEKKAKITHVGTLYVKTVKERKLFHHFSGKNITIPAYNRVTFKATKEVDEFIQD